MPDAAAAAEGRRVLSERHRVMAAIVGLLIVFECGAVTLLAAAFGFDLASFAHFGSLFDRPPEAAELLRWGALLDIGGYLAFGMVVLYVGHRLWPVNELIVGALTASGVGALIVGGTGAAVLGTVGPSLLGEFGVAPDAAQGAARIALDTLGRVVVAGLWGTITFGLLGAWLFGVGLLLQREKGFARAAMLGGSGMIASSIRTASTGRILPELARPADTLVVLIIVVLLAFFFIWLLWLAVRLWQDPHGAIAKSAR